MRSNGNTPASAGSRCTHIPQLHVPDFHPQNIITPSIKNWSTGLFPPSEPPTMDGIVSGVADLVGNASFAIFFYALSEDLCFFLPREQEHEAGQASKTAEESREESERAHATPASGVVEDTLTDKRTRNGGVQAQTSHEVSVSSKAKFAIEAFVSGAFDSLAAACAAIGISAQAGQYWNGQLKKSGELDALESLASLKEGACEPTRAE